MRRTSASWRPDHNPLTQISAFHCWEPIERLSVPRLWTRSCAVFRTAPSSEREPDDRTPLLSLSLLGLDILLFLSLSSTATHTVPSLPSRRYPTARLTTKLSGVCVCVCREGSKLLKPHNLLKTLPIPLKMPHVIPPALQQVARTNNSPNNHHKDVVRICKSQQVG